MAELLSGLALGSETEAIEENNTPRPTTFGKVILMNCENALQCVRYGHSRNWLYKLLIKLQFLWFCNNLTVLQPLL